MKNRLTRACNLFPIIFLMSILVLQLEAFAQRPEPAMGTAEFAKSRITKLQQTARTLQNLAVQPLPAQLSDKEKWEAERHTKWLKDSSQKLDELASRWHSRLIDVEKNQNLLSWQKQMAEMNQSFNLQYLALQENMQNESRQFSLISNVMKTKHDTAKNSISNLR